MNALICDDHPLMRAALVATVAGMIEGQVRAASDFPEAFVQAEAEAPGLCVVDLHMPGAGAVEGVSRLMAAAPEAKFVVVTGSEADDEMLGCLRLGVQGFVSKAAEVGVMEAAIRLVLAGGRYLPPRLADLAAGPAPIAELPPTAPAGAVEAAYGRISARQRRVLALMAEGRSNKQIAIALSISPATVKSHVAFLIAALGAGNRTEAAAKARQGGLV